MFRVVVLMAAIGGLVSGADVSKYRQDGYFGKETLKCKRRCKVFYFSNSLSLSHSAGQSIPADNTAVRRFNISMPESELTYLKERLANARFIEHIPETAFNYGFNSDELKQLVSYWNSTYDWRKEEAALNAYSQYLTQIEGIDVHFVHVPASPKAKTVIPLVTVHGWPSTFYEIYPSLPSLTEPDQDGVAYEVIAPSIPGFGWGEAAHQKGMENTAMARIFNKLMLRLGHEQYFLQGGDWGSIITRAMAIMYPEK